MQKNIIKSVLLVSFFIFYNSPAQGLSEEWQNIHNDDYSSLFIEASKIVEYGNEISVWVIEKLNELKTTKKDEKVQTIKTHYLFNKIKKRYAEIGIIYYNEKGRIVNRSSKSNFSSGPTAFMTPVSSNSKTEIIYNEVISYLITGEIKNILQDNVPLEEKKELASEESSENIELDDSEAKIHISQAQSDTNELTDFEESEQELPYETNETEIESWKNIPTIEDNAEVEQKPILDFSNTNKKNSKIELESINIQLPQNEYNHLNEKALKNAIFTDGNLFCFQVSSWKTKRFAQRELEKLLKKDLNAFIVSVKPKNKKDIWHRVRVGYFTSLAETKKVQKTVRKLR